MSTHITLVTPEFLRAELQARYDSPRRLRRERPDSSLRIEARAHRRRHLEALQAPRDAKAS